jgi:hypothetical protein
MNQATAILRRTGQVCLTYLFASTSGVAAFCISAYILLFGLAGMFTLRSDDQSMIGLTVMYAVGTLTYLLKRQIVHVRERRLPHAIWPHVFVWVVLIFLLTFCIPLIRVLCGAQIPLSLFGIVSIVSALSVWFFVAEVWWLIVFILPFFYIQPRLIPVPGIRQFLLDFLQGRHDAIGLVLFAVGIAGIAMGILRLIRLNEEDRGYFARMFRKQGNFYLQPSAVGLEGEAQRKQWQSASFVLFDPPAAAIPIWPIWARGTMSQRAKLLAVARGRPVQLALILGIAILNLFVMKWIISQSSNSRSYVTLLALCSIFPVAVAVGLWEQHRHIWGIELLRPVERSKYFVESGLAMAKQTLIAWLLMFAVILTGGLAMGFNTDVGWTSVKMAAITLGCQAVLFGIVVWLMRYRSQAVKILASMVIIPIYIISWVVVSSTAMPGWIAIGLIVLGMAAIGAGITYDAYRRWLVTELG